MPILRRCTGTRVIGLPSRKIWPALGSTSPAIMRRVVVLPQPLGPSSATMLPGSMLSETRSTAREAPKILVSSARRSAAGAVRTRSGSEDFVVLLDELRAHGIDERPVGAEDTHLAHLCFRIGHVFFDVGLEAKPAGRGGGKGL